MAERRGGSRMNRLYDRIRSPEASSAGERTGPFDPSAYKRKGYALVTTYRRDGTPVPTPVWFGIEGERLYFRTETASFKVARIRNDPRALVAPCTMRGKPRGPASAGRARILDDPAEAERAEAAIAANYGLERRLYEGTFSADEKTVYAEIDFAAAP